VWLKKSFILFWFLFLFLFFLKKKGFVLVFITPKQEERRKKKEERRKKKEERRKKKEERRKNKFLKRREDGGEQHRKHDIWQGIVGRCAKHVQYANVARDEFIARYRGGSSVCVL
jgi:Zn-dependent M16 (insulinase) family peptidase